MCVRADGVNLCCSAEETLTIFPQPLLSCPFLTTSYWLDLLAAFYSWIFTSPSAFAAGGVVVGRCGARQKSMNEI
jgi:hypothetical protein